MVQRESYLPALCATWSSDSHLSNFGSQGTFGNVYRLGSGWSHWYIVGRGQGCKIYYNA